MKRLHVALGVSLQALVFGGLAWTLEGPARLFSDGALAAFVLLTGALCGGEMALAPPPGLPAEATHRRGGWAGPALATGLGLLLLQVLAVGEHALRRDGTPPLVAVLGSGLILSGAGLRLAAIRTLGRAFQSEHQVRRHQRLVESGVFAWARHPSELGLLIAALGVAVLLQSVLAAVVWVVGLMPASLVRIGREELLLLQAFPDDFPRYVRRVPALGLRLRRANE